MTDTKKDQIGFSPSLLKSAIQKSIRRNDVDRAVKHAKLLLHKKPNDFWRRLPIIMLEDVVLHPDLRRVVELATASARKAYQLSAEDEEFGLRLVEQLARCKVRDTEFLKYLLQRKQVQIKYQEAHLKEDELLLIKAIYWRSCMGGMYGDIGMMRTVASIWQNRFGSGEYSINQSIEYFPECEIDYKNISLDENGSDVPFEAIDFHCSPMVEILLRKPQIKNIVTKFYPNKKPEVVLKQVIWRLRSGINYKMDIKANQIFDWLKADEIKVYQVSEDEANFLQIYQLIRDEVDNISNWFIKAVLAKKY